MSVLGTLGRARPPRPDRSNQAFDDRRLVASLRGLLGWPATLARSVCGLPVRLVQCNRLDLGDAPGAG